MNETRLAKLKKAATNMTPEERRRWRLDVMREHGSMSEEARLVATAVLFANQQEDDQ